MRRWLSVPSEAKVIINRVRGTRDLLVDESQRHRDVINELQRIVERFGFRSIQTPLLEYTDLFSRSLGGGSDIVMKEMYTFKDNSDKSVTLRPEGTAALGLRNMVLMQVIAMASDALDALGIKNKVVLELNSLGDNESRAKYRVALEEFFSKRKEDLSVDSVNRLERGSVLRILDSKSEIDQKLVADAPQLSEFLSDESKRVEEEWLRFDSVLNGLDALGVSYLQNPRLVRGLDYYSNTVFEFVERRSANASDKEEAPRGGFAVLAGGCYDGLAESLGGPATACVGWAAGVDRLNLLCEMPTKTIVSIAVVPVLAGDESNRVLHEAMRIAQAAERCGSTYAVIIGRAEIDKQHVKVKNLEKREEVEIPTAKLSSFEFC
ncbi:hypothetical protein KXD40_001986 [Peronospora effusa]|nr:hypothetical protein KXD40_001986 [Peronospora effusa]